MRKSQLRIEKKCAIVCCELPPIAESARIYGVPPQFVPRLGIGCDSVFNRNRIGDNPHGNRRTAHKDRAASFRVETREGKGSRKFFPWAFLSFESAILKFNFNNSLCQTRIIRTLPKRRYFRAFGQILVWSTFSTSALAFTKNHRKYRCFGCGQVWRRIFRLKQGVRAG